MNALMQIYYALGLLEGSDELYAACDAETLASLPAAARDRLKRGRLLEFLVHGDYASGKVLLNLASAWMQARSAVFAASHPREAAEYHEVMAALGE